MKPQRKFILALVAAAGFIWICWEAVRIRVEVRDYAKLSDVPAFKGCSGVDDVGPVRTIRYIHPHDNHETGATWITGEWSGSGFHEFAVENRLELRLVDGEWMNQLSMHLPQDFNGGLKFKSEDFTAVGQICGGRHYLKAAHSNDSGRFLFLITR